MNEVNARRARLQLGLVTVFGRVYHSGHVIMTIYRKKKFTSPKKVGGPEIGAAHKSQKVGGPRPIGSAASDYSLLFLRECSVVIAAAAAALTFRPLTVTLITYYYYYY